MRLCASFVLVSAFGLSSTFLSGSMTATTFSAASMMALLQSRLLRAMVSMLQSYVAGRGHSDRLCILAIILSLCGGPATEQANKSGGTLATTQSIHDSAEKSHIVVKDEHHRCRALLLAAYAIVRSGSNGKQRWQP